MQNKKVERSPIFFRRPIVTSRKVHRVPICRETKCAGCDLRCGKYKDSTILYAEEPDLIARINKVESEGGLAVLITRKSLPEDVILEMGYSPFNIIQYEIDITKPISLDMIASMNFTKSCGVTVRAVLYPVLPAHKPSFVIEAIEKIKVNCSTIAIKFAELAYSEDTIFVFNSTTSVKSDNFERIGDVYTCKSDFEQKFTKIVALYAKLKKIQVEFCQYSKCSTKGENI